MKTRAAVLREAPGRWSVEEVELDDPQVGEVLVQMVATGLCHSDDHMAAGDIPVFHLPMAGGHEGAGVVRKVGPGVTGLEVGDHIVTSFIPGCGTCRWCAMGMQNLCDNGIKLMLGDQFDGTFRMHGADGADIATMGMLGCFAEWQVYDQLSVVKIAKDIPLELACLVACGVQTGFGSATTAGNVQPGDVVIVAGVGGVGMNALQGARESGAAHVIAVDPVEDKRKWALDFGATESYESIEAAMDRVRHLTNGQGADVAILTAGLVHNELLGAGYQAIRKAGTLVVTGMSAMDEEGPIPGLNAFGLAMFQKRIQGALYGMKSPREATPMLLEMYRVKKLKLDELVTRTYSLDQINEGFDDMREGRNIRGVIHFPG
ncbi:NDMA-dependent alcohol dehydrogenase [Nocardia sp. 348MFTsu5.1]|uniref:NDMA-dependent alcohol dehydrogenase n=1 Tax=Nocardia sp. 348MFTsu5.1 TaxID=1172185 RepID=UPI00037A0C80|nr:NDMA-dependent alcohol dehydrogenase [Nocardia sp. 348MFTsu5.1]